MPTWDHRTRDLWIHIVTDSHSEDFVVTGFIRFYRYDENEARTTLLEVPISGSVPGQGWGGTIRRVLTPNSSRTREARREEVEEEISEAIARGRAIIEEIAQEGPGPRRSERIRNQCRR